MRSSLLLVALASLSCGYYPEPEIAEALQCRAENLLYATADDRDCDNFQAVARVSGLLIQDKFGARVELPEWSVVQAPESNGSEGFEHNGHLDAGYAQCVSRRLNLFSLDWLRFVGARTSLCHEMAHAALSCSDADHKRMDAVDFDNECLRVMQQLRLRE